MKQKKRLRPLLGAVLAAALFTGAAGAFEPSGFPVFGLSDPRPGRTTVEVQTADMDSENLSFTVPLYLTVAAVEDAGGSSRVITPGGYLLKNTTGSIPNADYPAIAVTGLAVRGVPGGTWSLKNPPSAAKDICLTIGGLTLPEVTAASTDPVLANIEASESAFYDLINKKFKPIEGGPNAQGLNLPIEGKLSSVYTSGEAPAAAQFRITYTVSLLDGGGQPVGVYYNGPNRDEAVTPSPGAVNPPPAPAGP